MYIYIYISGAGAAAGDAWREGSVAGETRRRIVTGRAMVKMLKLGSTWHTNYYEDYYY